MTRVARLTSLDGSDGLRITQEELPAPGTGHVILDMKAIGLNRAEAMFARGEYLVQPQLPNRIGIEGVGVVSAIGEGVEDVTLGQRAGVICALDMVNFGTAAERIVVPASMLLPDVPALADTELAAFWVAYLTAYAGMVQAGALSRGETVLISAASSSVGLAALQIADRIGARAVATTRTGAKKKRLLEAGAADVIVTDEEAVDAFEGGFDVAFDAVGGAFVEALGRSMTPGGRIVVYGALSGDPNTPFPFYPALQNDICMRAFHLGFHVFENEQRRTDALTWLRKAAAHQPFAPVVDTTFHFPELADAYRHMEAANQVGKIVVRINE